MSEQPEQQAERAGARISLRGLLLVVLGALALYFVLANGARVEVHYLFGDANSPLWLVIIIAGALGAAIDRVAVVRSRRLERKR